MSKKLGQPVPESNLVDELNKALLQQTHRYVPVSLLLRYCPVKGTSVPFSWVTKT
ncbi:uncharacterized protein METZ01_LOCUS70915 [marine metagenome]|uniref:Uncharacterized protein n=1 Tax=marine metagenome TaxID=408172 RepID=A0A381TRG6_9ZZZZ